MSNVSNVQDGNQNNQENVDTNIVCVDLLEEDWYVKITNNYNQTEYLLIRENIKDGYNLKTVTDPSTIFNNIILPESEYDPTTNELIVWQIADTENIYSKRILPEEYWDKSDDNLQCFEEAYNYDESGESGWTENDRSKERKSFFDNLMENL